MLASSRKAVASIPTVLKANYSAAAAANAVQISSAKNGIKVASIQDSSATAGISVVVNGGVKGEDSSNAGVAHFLKNYGFKVKSTMTHVLFTVCLATWILVIFSTHSPLYRTPTTAPHSASFVKLKSPAPSCLPTWPAKASSTVPNSWRVMRTYKQKKKKRVFTHDWWYFDRSLTYL